MKRIVIEVSDSLKHKIKVKCAKEGKTLKEFLTAVLESICKRIES